MRRNSAWLGAVMSLGALGAGCGNDCDEAAELMRQCCAKGPPELRAACEKEAKQIEDHGDAEACENTKNRLAGCGS